LKLAAIQLLSHTVFLIGRAENRNIVEAMATESREQLVQLVRKASSGTMCAYVSKYSHTTVAN
jgi:hypothetical protein